MKTVRGKLLMLLSVPTFIVLAILVLYSTNLVRNTIYHERKLKQKHVVETAYSILEHYHRLAQQGMLTEQQAKDMAKETIKTLRYEEVEYFWINDDRLPYPTMIMHPTNPALDGKVLDDPKYNCATLMETVSDGKVTKTDGKKNLFQAFVEVANADVNGGYVEYLWTKPLKGGVLQKSCTRSCRSSRSSNRGDGS
jgi:methyl-accepting chemotaxis protein